MRALYAGCNLFGQVLDSQAVASEGFAPFGEGVDDVLAVGHSVVVCRGAGSGISLRGHGLEPKKTHVETKLEFAADLVDATSSDTRLIFLDSEGTVRVLDFLDRKVELRAKPKFAEDKVIRIASGIGINVALTQNGTIYNIPNRLRFTSEDIADLKAGNEHCLLLDRTGNVYSFGNGSRGQLGHGSLDNEEEPKLIEALSGLKVIQIAAGSWHSCALTADGAAYTWGWNSDGQLGLHDSDVSVVATPQLVEKPDNIAFIAAGSRHSILNTTDNRIYGFGCNKFNQLGTADRRAYREPIEVHQLPEGSELRSILCGPSSTIVLLGSVSSAT